MGELAQLILDNRVDAQRLALVAVVIFAWWRGAGPERATGLALAYLLLADLAYHAVFGPAAKFAETDLGHAAIDTSGLVLMAIIAFFANRMYTLWVGALQTIAVFAHLARDLEQAISPLAYAITYIGPYYAQIVLLAFGVWNHRKRVRRYGRYRSWRTRSALSSGRRRLAWLRD